MYIDSDGDIHFEWDTSKARENFRKHGVSFEEAQTVFSDEQAVLVRDPEHSIREDRFILFGTSSTLRVLTVVHCYLRGDSVIRLISARNTTRSERAQYDARWL